MKTDPQYDIVLCVGKQHLDIALITIGWISRTLSPQNIFIITAKANFSNFQSVIDQSVPIHLCDEDTVIKNSSKSRLDEYFYKRIGSSRRAGWYFQQFLKLGAANLVINEHYLVWDADTVPLKKVNFFDDHGLVYAHTSTENHDPYFDLTEKLLGIKKQVDYSFITEHFMFQKSLIKELLNKIGTVADDKLWTENILDNINIEDLLLSGFSEYETYGNFLMSKDAGILKLRPHMQQLKSYRFGKKLFGKHPTDEDLSLLKWLDYDYVSFEIWDDGNNRKIKKNKKYAQLLSFTHKLPFFLNPLKTLIHQYIRKKMLKQIVQQ